MTQRRNRAGEVVGKKNAAPGTSRTSGSAQRWFAKRRRHKKP
jgi:hypothetical protein